MVFRSGNFAQERVPHAATEAVRTLTIESLYRQRGDAVVGDEGLLRRERGEVEPYSRREFEQRAQEDAVELLGRLGLDRTSSERFYRIDDEDSYFVEFAEPIDVPAGHVGLVRPRDTLRRAGVIIETAFVGPEDETVEALALLEDAFVLVAENAAVAELVVVETAD